MCACRTQIFNVLNSLNIDCHPDAHAVRLKFSLATMASSMGCPWQVRGGTWNLAAGQSLLTAVACMHAMVSVCCSR